MSEQPTAEDLARDLAADLALCEQHATVARFNWAQAMGQSVREPSGTGYPEFAWTAPLIALAACRRALAAEAILDAPQTALFADGREPTTNERHLLNLLSWREREATQAKEELAAFRMDVQVEYARLQKIIDDLADRVAAQSELLSLSRGVTKVVAYQPIELRPDDDGSPHVGEGH